MPETLDIDADPFLKLLTDALRAGPGSPDWHQAVQQLRAGGVQHADEIQMLIDARERLESGRAYREVRAGPEFTRKVMAGIDAEPANRRPAVPAANLIAIGGALVVLIVLGLVGYWLLHAPANTNEDLNNVYFATTVAEANFTESLPATWRSIGPMPLDPTAGLRAKPSATLPTVGDYLGGAIVLANGIGPDQP